MSDDYVCTLPFLTPAEETKTRWTHRTRFLSGNSRPRALVLTVLTLPFRRRTMYSPQRLKPEDFIDR